MEVVLWEHKPVPSQDTGVVGIGFISYIAMLAFLSVSFMLVFLPALSNHHSLTMF